MTTRGLASLVVGALLAAGAASCSDSTPPSAQGATQYRFTQPTDGKCDSADSRPVIGTVNGSVHTPVINEDNGVKVSCRVSPAGGGFEFTGTLVNSEQTESFELSGTVGADGAGTAKVSIYSDAVKSGFISRKTDTGAPGCEVSIKPTDTSPNLGASAGKIWASFTCEHMIPQSNSNSSSVCAIRDTGAPGGYFVFENCDQE
jgi:hypothetical protein